ncbi:hypothetical protein A3C98_05710 [Candidatus Roizmanbacteria bacterium RIFCSPHIGHO2_02_FULL_37_15]|nr:MAG: hypothetical protein A2859_03650 [Candidatus Roizmanbacteria bacterium RIFCSPHIGHO2_01_FULL_37_16b]OGK21507.1 MAG: hypothetical protein A3C98_05710 [Candidatus Roizmanbacteria bacterium RIFCSPHIGHO2_02_FULL_37_15]
MDLSRNIEGRILSNVHEADWHKLDEQERKAIQQRISVIGKLLGLDQELHGNILSQLLEAINTLEKTNNYDKNRTGEGDFTVYRMRLEKVIGKYKNAFYNMRYGRIKVGREAIVHNPQLMGEELSFVIASGISQQHFERISEILFNFTPFQLSEQESLTRAFERQAHFQDFSKLVGYLNESEINIGVRVVGMGENLLRKVGGNLPRASNVLTRIGVGFDRVARNFRINPTIRGIGQDLEIAIIVPKDVQILSPK